MKLPKLPPTDSGPLYAYAVDVQTVLQTLPETEYKTIQTNGRLPVLVSTRVSNVLEVRRCQTYHTKDPSRGVDDTALAWRKSNDPRQPGILITEIGGLLVDTDYTVVLAICGTGG